MRSSRRAGISTGRQREHDWRPRSQQCCPDTYRSGQCAKLPHAAFQRPSARRLLDGHVVSVYRDAPGYQVNARYLVVGLVRCFLGVLVSRKEIIAGEKEILPLSQSLRPSGIPFRCAFSICCIAGLQSHIALSTVAIAHRSRSPSAATACREHLEHLECSWQPHIQSQTTNLAHPGTGGRL